MQSITLSHLRTHANELKEALKRGEEIELTSHGQIIGIIKPYASKSEASDRDNALNAFFEAGETFMPPHHYPPDKIIHAAPD